MADRVARRAVIDIGFSIATASISEGSATLLKDFTIAMVIAAVGLGLARITRQPPVLGYLLAGVVIGPFTLPTPLISNLDTIGLLAELGLILLLFGIGLELGWRRIRNIGPQVLVIGVVEISVLTLFGVWLASILPGIDPGHGLYLGGALAISSSAILLKGLRDRGNLYTRWGQTIVGILLVEDFVVVILLTVLSGLSTTGTASLADAGLLAARLGAFSIIVLMLGTMAGGRLMDFLSRFQPDETLLLIALGACFLFALFATFLGLSPAAGAFLVGVVIGDTQVAGRINGMVAPVRDMFGALFFLSIGMLIDYRTLDDYLIPVLVVVAVFMAAKIAANTVGSIMAGLGPTDAFRVGMTMPQMGEFSLAIGRLTPASTAGGAALAPILSISTAVTSVLAPLTSRVAVPLSEWASQRAPAVLRESMLSIRLGVDVFWSSFSQSEDSGRGFRGIGRRILINMFIIALLSGAGTEVLHFIPEDLGDRLPVPAGVAGLVVVGIVAGLSIPSGIAIWRSLDSLARVATSSSKPVDQQPEGLQRRDVVRTMVEYGLAMVFIALLFLLILPLTSELLALSSLSVPVSLLLLLSPALAVGVFSFRLHRALERAVSQTFTSGEEGRGSRSQDGPEEARPGELPAESDGAALQPAEDTLLPEDNPLAPVVERMPERDELAHLLMGDGHHPEPAADGGGEDGKAGDAGEEAEGTGERRDGGQVG